MPAGSQPRTRRPSSLARVRDAVGRKGLLRPSLAAAIVGTILSLVTWWGFSVRETRLAELDFSTRADSYRSVLQAGIDDYVDRIQAIQVLFGTMGTISREQFLDFSNALPRRSTASDSGGPLPSRKTRQNYPNRIPAF